MQEASFVGFVKTILIILLVYYGIKIIFRWYGPQIMRYIMKKIGQRVSRKFNEQHDFQNQTYQRQEKSTIDSDSSTKRKSNKEVGEYIDYEEID